MNFAKVLFTFAVVILHACWVWGAWSIWQALPWWGSLLVLTVYLSPATLVLYWAGMAIDRAKEAGILPPLSEYVSNLMKPFAAVHNLMNNVLPMTIAFGFDLPRELATTKRLNRYADSAGDHWRKRLALAIREQLLNVFDWRGLHT